uniref:Uncharacterized protein n=1 Tax=Opuntia streptacantha TaxID=393608 RepID=A0A7C9DD46_OPUST
MAKHWISSFCTGCKLHREVIHACSGRQTHKQITAPIVRAQAWHRDFTVDNKAITTWLVLKASFRLLQQLKGPTSCFQSSSHLFLRLVSTFLGSSSDAQSEHKK